MEAFRTGWVHATFCYTVGALYFGAACMIAYYKWFQYW